MLGVQSIRDGNTFNTVSEKLFAMCVYEYENGSRKTEAQKTKFT